MWTNFSEILCYKVEQYQIDTLFLESNCQPRVLHDGGVNHSPSAFTPRRALAITLNRDCLWSGMISTAIKKRASYPLEMESSGFSGEKHKHSAIRNYLLGLILSGRLPQGTKVPSEYALAERFSANKTTCNKAVSMLASEGYLTRRRGAGTFVSDPSIRQRPCIGVLMNLRAGSFFSNLLVGIQEEAFDRGYGVQFFSPPAGEFDPDKFRHFLESSGVKGMVINRPFQRWFAGMENLYLNTSVPNARVSQVQTDDFQAGYLLGSYFLKMGHRHIAFVSQDDARSDLQQRAAGFRKALEEGKATDSLQRLQNFSKKANNLHSVLQRMLASDHRITGIAFDSVYVAGEAFRILSKLDFAVPSAISIAGMGNLAPGEQTLQITTINQYPMLMGHAAAETLINQIEGKLKKPASIVIPVDLIPGETVIRIERHGLTDQKI